MVCRTVARRAFARSARTLLRASAWGEHASAREQALACWQCFAQVAGQSGARKRRRAGRAVARQASRSTRAGVPKCARGARAQARARRRASRLAPASFFSSVADGAVSPGRRRVLGRPPAPPLPRAAHRVLEPKRVALVSSALACARRECAPFVALEVCARA